MLSSTKPILWRYAHGNRPRVGSKQASAKRQMELYYMSRRALCNALKCSLNDTTLAFNNPAISGKLSRYEMVSVMASHPSLAQVLIDDKEFIKKLKSKEIARLGSLNEEFGLEVVKTRALHASFTENDVAILGQNNLAIARAIFACENLFEKVYPSQTFSLSKESSLALIKISKKNIFIARKLSKIIKKNPINPIEFNNYLANRGAYFPPLAAYIYNQERFVLSSNFTEYVHKMGGRLPEIADNILKKHHLKPFIKGLTYDVSVNNKFVNATLWLFTPHPFCTVDNEKTINYNALYYALIVKVLDDPNNKELIDSAFIDGLVSEDRLDVMEYILNHRVFSRMIAPEQMIAWVKINSSISSNILRILNAESKKYISRVNESKFMNKIASVCRHDKALFEWVLEQFEDEKFTPEVIQILASEMPALAKSILDRPALVEKISSEQKTDLEDHVWVWERMRQACLSPAKPNDDVQAVEKKMKKLKM